MDCENNHKVVGMLSDGMVVIPQATISRLPLYFRVLNEYNHLGISVISSEEMAGNLGITSSQLRKDLSYFGDFGIRGTGYDVSDLLKQIKEILGMDKNRRIAIIGAGKLGTALAGYPGFKMHGLEVTALFDIDEAKIGQQEGKVEIFHLSELSNKKRELGMEIAVLTIPASVAQQVTELVIKAGFKAIWNFAPVRLEVPEHIILQNEDLVVGILTLSHHLSRKLGS
jgi:redox-sensing transcriptional repressor